MLVVIWVDGVVVTDPSLIMGCGSQIRRELGLAWLCAVAGSDRSRVRTVGSGLPRISAFMHPVHMCSPFADSTQFRGSSADFGVC